MFHFCTPWKLLDFWRFQGVCKWNIGLKWVNMQFQAMRSFIAPHKIRSFHEGFLQSGWPSPEFLVSVIYKQYFLWFSPCFWWCQQNVSRKINLKAGFIGDYWRFWYKFSPVPIDCSICWRKWCFVWTMIFQRFWQYFYWSQEKYLVLTENVISKKNTCWSKSAGSFRSLELL